MSRTTALLCAGARVALDGELFEVVELDGRSATVRNDRGRYRTVTIAEVAARGSVLVDDDGARSGARSGVGSGRLGALGPALASLTVEEQAAVAERASHIREVLTGYRAGAREFARSGEPPGVCAHAGVGGALPGQGGRAWGWGADREAVGGRLPGRG